MAVAIDNGGGGVGFFQTVCLKVGIRRKRQLSLGNTFNSTNRLHSTNHFNRSLSNTEDWETNKSILYDFV